MKPIDRFSGEYRFLSNFYRPCVVIYEGITYSSSEHAFQAAKTTDHEERIAIAMLSSPKDAKGYGRSLKLREGWNDMKNDVMLDILRLKFKNKDLRQKLLATGMRPLIEGNNWGDDYWGTVNGYGENWLGKLLMQVRREIRRGLI